MSTLTHRLFVERERKWAKIISSYRRLGIPVHGILVSSQLVVTIGIRDESFTERWTRVVQFHQQLQIGASSCRRYVRIWLLHRRSKMSSKDGCLFTNNRKHPVRPNRTHLIEPFAWWKVQFSKLPEQPSDHCQTKRYAKPPFCGSY